MSKEALKKKKHDDSASPVSAFKKAASGIAWEAIGGKPPQIGKGKYRVLGTEERTLDDGRTVTVVHAARRAKKPAVKARKVRKRKPKEPKKRILKKVKQKLPEEVSVPVAEEPAAEAPKPRVKSVSEMTPQEKRERAEQLELMNARLFKAKQAANKDVTDVIDEIKKKIGLANCSKVISAAKGLKLRGAPFPAETAFASEMAKHFLKALSSEEGEERVLTTEIDLKYGSIMVDDVDLGASDLEALKKSCEGLALIDSATVYYEMSLFEKDKKVVLLPYLLDD